MKARHYADKDNAKPALHARRAAAGALAAAVLLAQAIPAYAVDYWTADGTVHVKQDDAGPLSWQGENGDTSRDKEIHIYGGTLGGESSSESAQDATETETEQAQELPESSGASESQGSTTSAQIVQVDDGVQDVSIYIDGVSTTGTTDAAVAIGNNASVELYITDTKIEDAKGDGIAIGADSNVDITFAGENLYSAAPDAKDEKNAQNSKEEKDTAGIRVAESSAPAQTDTPETEQEDSPKVTIRVADEGGTALTVTNADTGIYIGQNSEVVITGEAAQKASPEENQPEENQPEEKQKEEQKESENTASQAEQQNASAAQAATQAADAAQSDANALNESAVAQGLTLKNNGVGVENHGTLTVTGGAEVTIDSVDTALETTGKNATTALEDDASVAIESGETVIANGATLTVEDATLTAEKVSLNNGAGMAIGSDAKVEANQIVDPAASGTSATSSWLVITGGTLELTGSKSEGTLANKMQPGLNADYMESLYTKTNSREYVIWPTNGAAHRSEKLVNFQLTADEAHHLFKTIDGMGNEYEYSVDLDKYEAGETLSVWVPAVLLDYYYRDDLPEDTSFEDMTEAEVLALLQATKYRGGLQDAVIRGQSIQFATLKGYTTGNVEEEGKTWYYYTASTADVEDGTVDEGAAAQTGQWLVFGANTPVTALDGQKLYAFSSEHFGEKNDTTMSETWEREDAPEDDLEDDLDSGASAQTSRTLGGLGSLGTGVFGNHGSTSATASLGEIDAQPNQPEQADPENPESQGGEKAAETPAADEESGGQGALQDTASYAVAGGAKTGDATPLWAACALLAVCGLAAAALHGKNGRKRRATCKH